MAGFTENFRDIESAKKLVDVITKLSDGRRIRIVHVCGTHEDAITKMGLRSLLPKNVEVLMGPGCPVCTVPPNRIDYMINLAKQGIIVTTFGDMMRVPAGEGSLVDAKAKGADVRVVYSIHDSVNIASNTKKEVVHFGVGFETTAPTSASELLDNPPNNFSVYSCHLLIPPAMSLLLELGETSVDGFINPGHVSTIIGTEGYRSLDERFHVPQVIAGFEPIDVLYAIAMIIRQVNKGRGEIENAYKRAVKKEGNTRAKAMMAKVFEPTDAPWRGIGMIPSSGLRIRKEYSAWDASERFGLEAEAIYEMPSGCRCGEVLRAVIYPWDCPLFNTACRPDSPLGPCMVSHEGSCFISAKYGVESP